MTWDLTRCSLVQMKLADFGLAVLDNGEIDLASVEVRAVFVLVGTFCLTIGVDFSFVYLVAYVNRKSVELRALWHLSCFITYHRRPFQRVRSGSLWMRSYRLIDCEDHPGSRSPRCLVCLRPLLVCFCSATLLALHWLQSRQQHQIHSRTCFSIVTAQ